MTRGKTLLRLVTVVTVIVMAAPARLVAQDESGPATSSSEIPRVTSEAAGEFASQLVGDDELTDQLRTVLLTQPGALVLRDRVGYEQSLASEDARAVAIPRWFDELFESSDVGGQIGRHAVAVRDVGDGRSEVGFEGALGVQVARVMLGGNELGVAQSVRQHRP